MKKVCDLKGDEIRFGCEVFGYNEETGDVELLYTRFFDGIDALCGFYKQLSDHVTPHAILCDKYGNKLEY